MSYLITGGCGFVGSNLAAELIRQGKDVKILDNLARPGTSINLQWLRTLGVFEFYHADTRNIHDIEPIFRKHDIDCIFHLAGQVAMTTSLEHPRRDFEVNVLGSINILECVRLLAPKATVVYASSNKVYGDLENLGLRELSTRWEPEGEKSIDERARLEFYTPYGCSKGAADQYMLDYARNFDVNSVVFRHSTIYGGRQISTFDQGWVGWFCQQAIKTRSDPAHTFTINGDGKQVRDLLHVSDAVACYIAAHQNIRRARGEAYNIGGGYDNSMSLLELFLHLDNALAIHMNPVSLPFRVNDQKYFVADNGKASGMLGWGPQMSKRQGLENALAWEIERGQLQ